MVLFLILALSYLQRESLAVHVFRLQRSSLLQILKCFIVPLAGIHFQLHFFPEKKERWKDSLSKKIGKGIRRIYFERQA